MLSGSTALAFCVAAILLAGGYAHAATGTGITASDTSKMTSSGFLSDYKRLSKVAAADGMQCWRQADVDAKQFDKVMITRILVTLKDSKNTGVDPKDLAALVDYFNNSLVTALKPQMQVVDKPGPGVLVLRIALTNLVPTSTGRSVAGTLIPFGYVAEAGSGVASGGPAGSTPYLGQTGMEMQFLNGATSAVVAECRDAQIGRKYAADIDKSKDGAASTWMHGYMNSFDAWAYARNAFDKWSLLLSNRLAELRGVAPAAK
jgi:uncharacterized protein DUF3313